MKKLYVITLTVLLIISIGYNVFQIFEHRKQTNEVLGRYKSELLRSTNAFQASVATKPIRDPMLLRRTAGEAAAVALELADVLGKQDSSYSLNNKGRVYQDLPYEISWLVMESWDTSTSAKKDRNERINNILQVYAKNIQDVNINNPDQLRQMYLNIRNSISQNDIQKDITLPVESVN